MEIYQGEKKNRDILKTAQEEVDVIIIQKVAQAVNDGAKCIHILCDDTDVFITLVYHFIELHLKCCLTMEGTSAGHAFLDLGATSKKHEGIVRQLPAAHALTGCDTVAHLWGIGEITPIKTLKAGQQLQKLAEVIAEAAGLIAACYGNNKRDKHG